MPSLRTRINYDRIALEAVDDAVVVAQAAAVSAAADAATAQDAAEDAQDGVVIVEERTAPAREFLDAF